MITTVDSSQRVFMITGDMNRSVFCNLHDIPAAVADFDSRDNMNIYHFWNFKQKRASKKMLNEMFKGARMKFRIN